MSLNRREFLKSTGLGISVLSLTGAQLLLSPREARAKGVAFKVLNAGEVTTLEAFADTLLPGCAEAGVAYFVDEQLARDANDSLLMARYLQVEPPYAEFYKGSLASLNGYCQKLHGKPFYQLSESQRNELAADLFRMGPEGPQDPAGWQGPPAALVYLCLRSDAVDVVYGTVDGFKELDIPYMAHIEPPTPW